MPIIRVRGFDGVEASVDVSTPPRVVLQLTNPVAIAEFRFLMARALNTLDPDRIPQWVMDFSDGLDYLGESGMIDSRNQLQAPA